GRAAGGFQLLAAIDGHALLVVVFDGGGDFRESFWWDLAPGEEDEEALRERLGWEPTLVRVKRFRVPPRPEQPRNPLQLALVGEDGFAIAPIPPDWQESIDDPESLGAEREDF